MAAARRCRCGPDRAARNLLSRLATMTNEANSTADTTAAMVLERLFAVIESRQGRRCRRQSYTAKLLSARDAEKIAQKVGEEAVETVIAAMGTDIDARKARGRKRRPALPSAGSVGGSRGCDRPRSWGPCLAERDGISGIAGESIAHRRTGEGIQGARHYDDRQYLRENPAGRNPLRQGA